jgi:hypothetical protein
VLWRQLPKGKGGQFGAQIAFSPDGQYLFLTVGDRQRFTPAQDPNQELGKILRLTLDGKPAPGNPMAGKTGASSVTLIDPPRDTEAAKTAPVVSTYNYPGPNLALAENVEQRSPHAVRLAFGPDGRLWEVEHGPRGGDELNLIEPGKNYGWPLVSYATNYNGVPIPSPDTRADLAKPVIYWTPVIAPGNIMFYSGAMFPQWKGSALIGGMGTTTDQPHHVRRQGLAPRPPSAGEWQARARHRAGARRRAVDRRGRESGGLYRLTPKTRPAPPSSAMSGQPVAHLRHYGVDRTLLRRFPARLHAEPGYRGGTARPFNEAGVTMGHWHLTSKNVEADKKLFLAMGGKLYMRADCRSDVPGLYVNLALASGEKGDGGSEGSVVNHVGFIVDNVQLRVAQWKAAGVNVLPGLNNRLDQAFVVTATACAWRSWKTRRSGADPQ